MRFSNESDLRKEVREAFPGSQWVEAALGGSTGLPDCFINDVDGDCMRVAFFELKTGELRGSVLHFTVRPAQRKRIKGMKAAGYAVWFLVGEKGGERLWRVPANEDARLGRVMVDDPWVVPIGSIREELLAGAFRP